jgi:hypothetical protein
MTQPDRNAVYQTIVTRCLLDADVSLGKMLKAESIQVKGKSFAYLGTDGLVVKLPADRVSEMEELKVGKRLIVGKRTMKEWLVVADTQSDRWPDLVAEAQQFVGG